MADLIATDPTNGVRWRRKPGGTSTPAQLLAAFGALQADGITRDWNLWRSGEPEAADEARHAVIFQWEHAEPPPGGYNSMVDIEAKWDAKHAEEERLRAARAEAYDPDLAEKRFRMFQKQANAGFMRHVAAKPASEAQRAKAEERAARFDEEAVGLADEIGDPDAIADQRGYLPPERRSWHRRSLFDWRHRQLRELSGWRFQALLAMPAPARADMCTGCEAPADWHTYHVSLCLYRGTPEPGSRAETLARLMPGWWERCVACATYNFEHRWGSPDTLPDFGGDQWAAMLPVLLRALFAPDWKPPTEPPKPRRKPDPRRALEKKLRAAVQEARTLRKELDALGPADPPAT